MRTTATEADVLKAIKDLLAALHVPAFRTGTGAFGLDYTAKNGEKKRRFVRFGEKGMADLVAFPRVSVECSDYGEAPRPLILWIETKAPKGRQSEHQKAFQQYVEAHGMHYLVAWDAEDVYQWLKARGVK